MMEARCTECYSTKVEQKAWVKINEPVSEESVDLVESPDAEDFWCFDCDEHRMVKWVDDKLAPNDW